MHHRILDRVSTNVKQLSSWALEYGVSKPDDQLFFGSVTAASSAGDQVGEGGGDQLFIGIEQAWAAFMRR